MGAIDLLSHLRGKGLALTLRPSGELHISPRGLLDDELRAVIRERRDQLVRALGTEPASSVPRPNGNPLMSADQGAECHAGGWTDQEVELFMSREARFSRLGFQADAENLAERMTLRDRQHDDRRMCLECFALDDNLRCLMAARGRLAGVGRSYKPMPATLQRCEGFGAAIDWCGTDV